MLKFRLNHVSKRGPWDLTSIVCSWWRHRMETFFALLVLVRGIHRPPVDSPHKGLWRGALMFSLICTWTNGWEINRDAGDLRRHRAHYDVTVMYWAPVCCKERFQLPVPFQHCKIIENINIYNFYIFKHEFSMARVKRRLWIGWKNLHWNKDGIISWLILCLRPANERRRYKVTLSLIVGWV